MHLLKVQTHSAENKTSREQFVLPEPRAVVVSGEKESRLRRLLLRHSSATRKLPRKEELLLKRALKR